jgi:hypothetical protein
MRGFKLAAWAALAFLATTLSAHSVEVGQALGVDPQAEAVLDNQTRILEVGVNLSIGEVVKTGPEGLVQIIFRDQSRLAVGPNSTVTIEQYLLRNETQAENFTIDTLNGTFRFITGKSPKAAYRFETPHGTIAVRGTAFDWAMVEPFGTILELYFGEVTMCALNGECQDIARRCGFGAMDTTQVNAINSNDNTLNGITANLPYLFDQLPLLTQLRVQQQLECFRALRTSETFGSGSEDDENNQNDDQGEGEGGDDYNDGPRDEIPEDSM